MDLKKLNLKTSIATMIQLWMRVLSMFISGIETGNVPYELEVDVLDAIAGETFLVKTWADIRQLKSITVSRDNAIRFTAFFYKTDLKISRDLQGVIFLENNNVTREMSLILENFNKVDEGKYNVEEIAAATIPNPFERKYGNWNFTLNVIDPKETKKCSVGESIEIKFRISSIQSHLYYYDKRVAFLFGSDCNVLKNSHLYGRLRCSIDNDRSTIIIENVTQRDIGLYKVNNNDIERIYLNVTDQTTNVTIGENVTIDWFYSQQAINRTVRIIHSNNGIIMNLSPNNEAQIVPAFREHVLYSGDISRCYMSLTLLNIGKLDSGVYKIETLHGSTISGCKHLFVGEITTAITPNTVERYTHLDDSPSTYTSVHIQYSQANSVIIGSGDATNLNTSTTDMQHYTPSVNTYDQHSTIIRGVPFYVFIPMAVITLTSIGCVIWIHHKRTSTMETDRPHSLEEFDTDLYLTPIRDERHLPIPLLNDGHVADSNHAQFDSRMLLLHTNQTVSMDGYEIVDVARHESYESIFNDDETVHYPTESISGPVPDNFGYLTVLGVLETSV